MNETAPLILVVEDDKFYAAIYQTKLEREGYRVITARNGQEALDQVKADMPAMILLDLVMPVMDGYETLQYLRADESTKNIPVLVFSNLGQEEDIQRIKELGVTDYLVKTNISIAEMVEKIKQHLPAPATT